jgi:acyl carrier protein
MDSQLSIKTMSTDNTAARIRNIIKQHARLSADADSLAPSADLYEAGMTSHASVNVMLALEGEFEVEFPDRMLTRGTFDSIASIQNAIEALTSG